MEYEKKQAKHRALCLECGNVIRYGRTDKKFCCDECKTKHHNLLAKDGRLYRRKVLGIINRNYEILEGLVKAGADSVDLAELTASGFVPGVTTSYSKSGKHDLYTCFDIKYIMTRTRIYSIERIQKL